MRLSNSHLQHNHLVFFSLTWSNQVDVSRITRDLQISERPSQTLLRPVGFVLSKRSKCTKKSEKSYATCLLHDSPCLMQMNEGHVFKGVYLKIMMWKRHLSKPRLISAPLCYLCVFGLFVLTFCALVTSFIK